MDLYREAFTAVSEDTVRNHPRISSKIVLPGSNSIVITQETLWTQFFHVSLARSISHWQRDKCLWVENCAGGSTAEEASLDREVLKITDRFQTSSSCLKTIERIAAFTAQWYLLRCSKQTANILLRESVPHGSVFGPTIFTMYTAPLGDIIMSHGLQHIYDISSLFFQNLVCFSGPSACIK